ncbi:MAG: alkaline phosphatase, partial [Flavobacteriales bacterium]|nr:alkaline phosphatase [Flavobacteriales bacterium]
MKFLSKLSLACVFLFVYSCNNPDLFDNFFNHHDDDHEQNDHINFQYKSTISVGGEGASEISAYDAKSKRLFVVNVELHQISVFNISNIDSPMEETPIVLGTGSPNSVAVNKGLLAIAVEADPKQNLGSILVYDATSLTMLHSYQVGALPDMVTFSPNGQYIVSA